MIEDEKPFFKEEKPGLDNELEQFKRFAELLKRRRTTYKHNPKEDKFDLQKRQLEHLGELEDQFRLTLIQSPYGKEIYKGFIFHIHNVKKNILAARPFFRERQQVFTDRISSLLKEENWRELFEFHINYQFVSLAIKNLDGRSSELLGLSKQIQVIRKEITETNLPLAIARAKKFWSKTPKSQLTFMDFVQIATEGLLAAIDKFVLPYSNVFRCVAIGRMLGNFIEAYSETTLHFYPTDRRKVYRANKYLSKHQFDIDYEDLAATVNSDVKGSGFSTNPSEIYNLVTAVSCVSANTKIPSPVRGSAAGVENITQYAAEDNSRPDVQYEVRQALHMLEKEVSKLNLVEKKLLKLKGIDFALAVS